MPTKRIFTRKDAFIPGSDKDGLIDLYKKQIEENTAKRDASTDPAYRARCDRIIAELQASIKKREAEKVLIRNYRPSPLGGLPSHNR